MYTTVDKPLRDVLGLAVPDTVKIKVRVYDLTDPIAKYAQDHVPQIEPYLFPKDLVRDTKAWMADPRPEPLLIYGPTGAGKTSFILQLAARLNIPVWETTGHEELELSDIFGQFVLNEKGATVYMDGNATQAAKFGGWHLINEMDRMRPGVAVGLNSYMEGRSFTLSNKGGEVVRHNTGSAIIATANTNFVGDETNGSYLTAQIHDKSVIERMGMVLKADYLGDDEERALLADAYKDVSDESLKYWFEEEGMKVANEKNEVVAGQFITRDLFINTILKFRKLIRDQSVESGNQQGNALERTMSTRTLLRWAKQTILFNDAPKKGRSALHYALARSLTSGCTPTSRDAIHSLLQANFGIAETL